MRETRLRAKQMRQILFILIETAATARLISVRPARQGRLRYIMQNVLGDVAVDGFRKGLN